MSRMFQTSIGALFFLSATLVASIASAQSPLSAGQVFRLTAERNADGSLTLAWRISPGTYLYRDKIAVRAADGRALAVATQAGERKDDPNFGPTEVYHLATEAWVAAPELPPAGPIVVTYQGCAERGICYPPVTREIDLTAAVGPQEVGGVPASVGTSGTPAAHPEATWIPAPSVQRPSQPTTAGGDPEDPAARLSGGFGAILVTFLGFGLLLALTPCVFPMIPILSGLLASSNRTLSAGRGFALSAAYVMAMAVAYAGLGMAAAWSGQNLQVVLQTPIALGIMSLVFVALAFSMFGFYNLSLPQSWSARLANVTAGKGGSIGGSALLGFVSTLIVGPCVTPPLAAALLYVAQTGDVARGTAALFALGLGMGLPLIAFGTFGARLLPRSGRWLVVVKQSFGFIFLGLAVWIAGRFLPEAATIALWVLVVVACGVWLGTHDLRHSGARPDRRLSFASVGRIFAFCGVVFIAGTAAGMLNPLHMYEFFREASARNKSVSGSSRTVTTSAALDAAVAAARTEGRPILIDFTATWCTACRDIDRTVMADPAIKSRLTKVSIIRADLTVTTAETQALMRRFAVVGPPTMLFLDPDSGREIEGARTVGEVSVTGFGRALDRVGA